ncbi:MAG: hypothetical protein KAH93_03610 [Candidatus Aenigmarchaeota archaeon]|nr:hypothetical protein [Candidatus Aenigmarchaeota archaeon]
MVAHCRMRRKGASVTVESVLFIGGLIASILFFASFYNLVIYQISNVFATSEREFAGELKSKISMVYLSKHDNVEYLYDISARTYRLTVDERRLSIKYPTRDAVSVILSEDVRDADIENSQAICIRKTSGIIELKEGTCPGICNIDDEVCDKGCRLFDVCDPKCKDCEGSDD